MSNTHNVADYFSVIRGGTLHKYPVETWESIFSFRQERGYGGGLRPRLEAWFGPSGYGYGVSGTARKSGYVKSAIRHASKFVAGHTLNSCLAVLYRDGRDSVAWHADDESDMGPAVVSASFGSSRRFSVRNNQTRQVTNFELEHGDLLIMKPGAQEHFQHCIRKTRKAVGPRVCLTFREVLF